jgi:hypothetical protein
MMHFTEQVEGKIVTIWPKGAILSLSLCTEYGNLDWNRKEENGDDEMM